MIDKKILILSTYPIKTPQHGGQKRLNAILKAYERNYTQVRSSAVFFRGFYAEYTKDDITLGPESERLVHSSPLTGDIIAGEAVTRDLKVKAKLSRLLKDYSPDIIHIEQPFLYLGLKELLKELKIRPRLIFGSQNIEGPMKREILHNSGMAPSDINKYVSIINNVEAEITRDSDLVVACTEEDKKVHQKYGAKNIVVAVNGADHITTNMLSINKWNKIFKSNGIQKKVVFIGSAHPPNWTGFLTMVGRGLGFLSYGNSIVLAGSICDYFEREINPDAMNIYDATFWLRAFSAGRLSQNDLDAIISLSDVIILPITEGGGSNLKTAEAILANKKVVTTKHALRSFEWFEDFPNVWATNAPDKFKNYINDSLDAQNIERSNSQQQKAETVTWEYCLLPLIKEVRRL